MNITSVPTARNSLGEDVGTVNRYNRDGGDNDYDTINWVGTLETTGHNNNTIYIQFNVTVEESVNFPNNANSTNLDSGSNKGVTGNYSSGTLFSGISISSKFARGDIRQGIDMSQDAGSNIWSVRGFIRNMANESPSNGYPLTYNVSEWRIYQIIPGTGAPHNTPNQTGYFNQSGVSDQLITPSDGRIYTTDSSRSTNTSWFNTTSTTKPYFTVYFDWEVVWDDVNPNNYEAYINTTLDLPILYKIDMVHEKRVVSGFISPDTGGQNLTFYENVTFWGNESASAKQVEIFCVIPANTTAGNFHGKFYIHDDSSLELYYVNQTGAHKITIEG